MDRIGKWAFIAGLLVAVLGAFFAAPWFSILLVVLGLVVGFLNVTAEESQGFLIAAIALLLSATAVNTLPFLGETVASIMGGIVVFIGPAVLVVAIKSLFETARH